MWENIFFLIMAFLSLIGVSEVIYFSTSLVFKPKFKPKKYLVVKLSADYAEQQILSEIFNLRWFGTKLANKLIFITDKLTVEQSKRLAKEYKSDTIEFKNGVFNERE